MSDDQPLPASLAPVSVRDTRLIARAIRQRWPIREEIRQALVDRQVAIATSETCNPSESTAAFRSIVAAEAQNIGAEKQPKRKTKTPPAITTTNLIVVGDLAESKRRAIAYMNELFAQRDARRDAIADDA